MAQLGWRETHPMGHHIPRPTRDRPPDTDTGQPWLFASAAPESVWFWITS